jgi:hypothetical protein
MAQDRLHLAIQLLKDGKKSQARELILAEVKQNSSNLSAWLWALEVAANEKEKRTILNRILTLDPHHKGALMYLKKLDASKSVKPVQIPDNQQEPSTPEPEPSQKVSRIGGLFKLFFDWLTSLPGTCGFIVVFAAAVLAAFIYFRINTSFFGLGGADFDELVISNSYEKIEAEDYYWDVQFEGIGESKYIGTVRHVAPIRIREFKILTHDILVTTADFSDPEIVTTNVIDHKFFWKSVDIESPNGSINLIHAIPANKEIYQTMLTIENWDIVKITGREIHTIKSYTPDGTFLGTWQDTGCNTLLVEFVSVLKAPPTR